MKNEKTFQKLDKNKIIIEKKCKELHLKLLDACQEFYDNEADDSIELPHEAIFMGVITNFIIDIYNIHKKNFRVKDFQEFLYVFSECYNKKKKICMK